ncbi:MAG: cysteine peptidase family C39 domain-containing protein [Haliea sp.]|uniref:C39 family peptidase n=1 Tax=Haliea sp. TaxID=1932666 RepID=UPI0032EC6A53
MSRRGSCFDAAGGILLGGWLLAALGGSLSPATAPAAEGGFRNWVTLRDAGVVRQQRDFSCGVAALATYLSHYLRTPVTETELLALLDQFGDSWNLPVNWRQQGVSYAILLRLARHHGLQGAGMSVTPELLGSLTVPAIVRLEVHGVAHFSVLKGIDRAGRVQLADPSWGNHRLGREAFLSLWLDPEFGGAKGTLMLFRPMAGSSLRPAAAYFGVDERQPLLRPPA